MNRIVLLLCISILASCSPKSLGYFEVDPFFKPTATTIEEPLYIDFGSKVQDDYTLAQPGLRTLNVHFFKQSYQFALAHTFNDQFKSVEFLADEKNGFMLKVYRFEPTWWIGDEKEIIRKEFNDTLRYREFACAIKYESTLFYNGQKVSEANGEVRQTANPTNYWKVEDIFKDAVKASCEDMATKIASHR